MVAAGMHEFFKWKHQSGGPEVDYFFDLTAQGYKGIGSGNIKTDLTIKGVEYVAKNLNAEDTLIIVDDIWDTGTTFDKLLEVIKQKARKNAPKIKIATVVFKPSLNKSQNKPDFYIYETDDWLVQYWETDGLTQTEIGDNRKDIYKAIYGDFNYPKKL